MADLAAVRNGLADAINTLSGARAWAYPPDQVQAPAILIEPDEVDWATAFGRGHESWRFLVHVLISTVNNTAAQKARDEYFGNVSDLKDAIEHYAPLKDGTVAASVFVRNARRFSAWKYAETTYLGVEVVVEIQA
jgi:hypothetical protein